MRLVSCVLVLALGTVGYAQSVAQAAAQPKAAVAPSVAKTGYWYRAPDGWCYWQPAPQMAMTPATTASVPPAPPATGQPHVAYRFSYDPSRTPAAAAPMQPEEQIRMLQQEVSRLQRIAEQMAAPPPTRESIDLQDWFFHQQRGETNGDPALFQ